MKEPITTEKVTDASLTRSIISSVIGIVLCMVCLFGTTWAWYSLSVTSGTSETVGANFDFDVSIENITPTEGVYPFDGGVHTVTLTKTGTAEKGFCKVEAKKSGEDAETITYYIVDFTGEAPVEFTVKGSGTLKLIPMLGTPTAPYAGIPAGGIVLTPDPELKNAKFTQEETTSEEPEPEEEPIDGEPLSEDETPSGGTSANSDTTEQEPPTEPISEPPASQPEP